MDSQTERKAFDLANAICEKSASEDEIQNLNDLMLEFPEARQIYLKVMDMHFDLDRMSLTGALAVNSDRCEPLLGKLEKVEAPKSKKSAFPYLMAAAALIAVCFSIFLTTNIFSKNKYEAVVIESLSKEWLVGSTFKLKDKVTLTENESIKLKFGDETVVEVSGPISTSLDQSDKVGRKFTLSTPEGDSESNKLILNSGNNTVQVSHSTKAYKSRFKIIDSGNAFGVQFKDKLTEVHVFKGLVTSHSETAKMANTETQQIHNLQAAGFNKQGLLKKWTHPDYKTFKVERNISGVQSTNRHVHWLSTKPESLAHGQLQSNESIFLIQEKKNIVLPHEIPVTFSDRLQRAQGGTQSGYKGHIRMLPKGTKVDSYLLHFDPATNKFLDGDILFDRPIVAIIARAKQLDYSDKFFALDNVRYPAKGTPYRGLDGDRKDENVDVLKFQKDSRKIGIRFNIETETIDQIRILVESE